MQRVSFSPLIAAMLDNISNVLHLVMTYTLLFSWSSIIYIYIYIYLFIYLFTSIYILWILAFTLWKILLKKKKRKEKKKRVDKCYNLPAIDPTLLPIIWKSITTIAGIMEILFSWPVPVWTASVNYFDSCPKRVGWFYW